MAHWVTHGDDLSTHILHPTLGHASVLLQEGQVPILLLLLSLTDFVHTHPSRSV